MGPSGKWIEGLRPDGSVAEAARVSLSARLSAVAHWLPLAAYHAEQDNEHVHRLRVSTRRAVAALELYAEWLPRKRARWVTKQLKKIRRAAGDARDLDVLAERLQRESAERAASVLKIIAEKRAAVQPAIVGMAERASNRDRFLRKTAKLLSRIRPRHKNGDSAQQVSFRDWASAQLATTTTDFFGALPVDTVDMAALHQFRIRAKRLRYQIELLAPAFGAELREVHYPLIEELQERLGKVNDHVTAANRLREWAAPTQDCATRESLEALIAEEATRLGEALRDFRDWWSPEQIDNLRSGLSGGDLQLNEACTDK